MKERSFKTTDLAWMGLLTALGILIPYLTSHMFGIQGTVMLPMHYTVFIAGALLGPFAGAVCGIVTPVLSAVFTGMPPFLPMLPVMVGELAAYGIVTGIMYYRNKINIFISIITAMLVGRAVHGIIFALLMMSGGADVTFKSAFYFVVEGIPGTVLQLILLPILIKSLELLKNKTDRENGSVSTTMEKLIKDTPFAGNEKTFENAVAAVKSGDVSVAVIKNGTIVHTASGRGISPVLGIIESDPEILKDAAVVDKIVGKAAAMLFVRSGVKAVYAVTMSRAGREFLEKTGMPFMSELHVENLINRTNTGICPFEQTVMDIDDPEEAFEAIKDKMAQLKAV